MKYTIAVEPPVQKALETIALLDTENNIIITPEDIILMAIEILLRIRSLSYEEQKLLADIIEFKNETA